MNPFLIWVYALVLFASPVDKRAAWQEQAGDAVPVAQRETRSEGQARYWSIAKDIVRVTEDPEVAPLYPGPDGWARTVALLVAVGKTESAFRKDVDEGSARGDHGRSWCLFQIQTGRGHVAVGSPTMRTWTGPDLVKDREKCVRVAIEMLRQSLGACRRLAEPDRLSAYTSGQCLSDERESRRKTRLASALLQRMPAPARELPAQPVALAPVDSDQVP